MFGVFFEFVDHAGVDVAEGEFEEGFFVHFIGFFEVAVEFVFDAVGEDANACF